jgi:hypothetical protein
MRNHQNAYPNEAHLTPSAQKIRANNHDRNVSYSPYQESSRRFNPQGHSYHNAPNFAASHLLPYTKLQNASPSRGLFSKVTNALGGVYQSVKGVLKKLGNNQNVPDVPNVVKEIPGLDIDELKTPEVKRINFDGLLSGSSSQRQNSYSNGQTYRSPPSFQKPKKDANIINLARPKTFEHHHKVILPVIKKKMPKEKASIRRVLRYCESTFNKSCEKSKTTMSGLQQNAFKKNLKKELLGDVRKPQPWRSQVASIKFTPSKVKQTWTCINLLAERQQRKRKEPSGSYEGFLGQAVNEMDQPSHIAKKLKTNRNERSLNESSIVLNLSDVLKVMGNSKKWKQKSNEVFLENQEDYEGMIAERRQSVKKLNTAFAEDQGKLLSTSSDENEFKFSKRSKDPDCQTKPINNSQQMINETSRSMVSSFCQTSPIGDKTMTMRTQSPIGTKMNQMYTNNSSSKALFLQNIDEESRMEEQTTLKEALKSTEPESIASQPTLVKVASPMTKLGAGNLLMHNKTPEQLSANLFNNNLFSNIKNRVNSPVLTQFPKEEILRQESQTSLPTANFGESKQQESVLNLTFASNTQPSNSNSNHSEPSKIEGIQTNDATKVAQAANPFLSSTTPLFLSKLTSNLASGSVNPFLSHTAGTTSISMESLLSKQDSKTTAPILPTLPTSTLSVLNPTNTSSPNLFGGINLLNSNNNLNNPGTPLTSLLPNTSSLSTGITGSCLMPSHNFPNLFNTTNQVGGNLLSNLQSSNTSSMETENSNMGGGFVNLLSGNNNLMASSHPITPFMGNGLNLGGTNGLNMNSTTNLNGLGSGLNLGGNNGGLNLGSNGGGLNLGGNSNLGMGGSLLNGLNIPRNVNAGNNLFSNTTGTNGFNGGQNGQPIGMGLLNTNTNNLFNNPLQNQTTVNPFTASMNLNTNMGNLGNNPQVVNSFLGNTSQNNNTNGQQRQTRTITGLKNNKQRAFF